ncbi:hypothetical protein [Oryzicola mucosus]|uniref:Uncharacterized protein n=1 Tax=Oryzicola mucosus TaxID=2767425 RepID=A0A8J6PJJ7_9HYPH|nr:hypothetical protein [Oryzicola mucosus]MBD0416119.1 hypothetical protein [Oryzicola mucosus]
MRADDTDNILYHAIHMLDVTFSGRSNATMAFLLAFSGKKYLRQTRLGLVEHTDTVARLRKMAWINRVPGLIPSMRRWLLDDPLSGARREKKSKIVDGKLG